MEEKLKHFLLWFWQNADFGPAHGDVMLSMEQDYTIETGQSVPEGFSYSEE